MAETQKDGTTSAKEFFKVNPTAPQGDPTGKDITQLDISVVEVTNANEPRPPGARPTMSLIPSVPGANEAPPPRPSRDPKDPTRATIRSRDDLPPPPPGPVGTASAITVRQLPEPPAEHRPEPVEDPQIEVVEEAIAVTRDTLPPPEPAPEPAPETLERFTLPPLTNDGKDGKRLAIAIFSLFGVAAFVVIGLRVYASSQAGDGGWVGNSINSVLQPRPQPVAIAPPPPITPVILPSAPVQHAIIAPQPQVTAQSGPRCRRSGSFPNPAAEIAEGYTIVHAANGQARNANTWVCRPRQ